MRRLWLLLALTLLGAAAVLGTATLRSGADPYPTITISPAGSQPGALHWNGTISAANVHPTSDCNDPGTGAADQFGFTVAFPRGDEYQSFNATFTISISWTTADETTNDEILTLDASGGADPADTQGTEIATSDGSDTTETVTAHNLGHGTYTVLACGYNNVAPQSYTGTVAVAVTPKSASAPLAAANAQGLAFSSAVPADPQRDVAEPLIVSDPDGVLYDCGPTGFSNASDYAEVSTDGGEQFHLMGTPPRGQQGLGGGGDCGLATGLERNAQGHYTYAYAGLGALTGFTTSRSPDDGHSIANTAVNGNGLPGATSNGALADRQWMTFTDDHTVLLSYNQQQPRNIVVQTSTDGGLTYSVTSAIAAPNPDFPGPMHYIPSSHTVVMPWTKGESVNLAVSRDGGATWFDCNVAKGSQYVGGGTAGFATADVDTAGNVYVAWADKVDYHVWMASVTAAQLAQCTQPPYSDLTVPGGTATQGDGSVAGTADGIPTDTVASTPVQVDRDEVKTTVFPWIAAGGSPGRVAVAFYGTDQDGDPNTNSFLAAWNVYVNQSLDALDGASAQFSQVKASTHPFHYDSICLNGLGCDTTEPGDRSLADFFAITYNQKDGKLSVVWDRGNKRPNDSAGYVATPMVATQIAGPSNGGGTVTSTRTVVATSASDPTGDALANYSAMAEGTEPTPPNTTNEPGADFTGVDISPDAATGGFTVTMHLADLSTAALTQALTDSGSSSLQYVWRFGNGYQDAGASAAWSPAAGWTFGFDQYTTGSLPCGSDSGKCVIWPQANAIHGSVDAAAGTITLVVPQSDLYALGPNDANGRPTQVAATAGSRFYDGSAWSFANTEPAPSLAETWMEQLDNTPAFDFVLPAGSASSSGGGGGGSSGGGGGGSSGGGGGGGSTPPATTTTSAAPAPSTPATAPVTAGVRGARRTVAHLVVLRGTVRAAVRTATARAWINRKSVLYVDRRGKLRFRSTRVTSVAIRGHSATLRGVGTRNGKRGVRFRVVLVAGKPATLHVWFGRYVRSARLVSGTAIVR
jgi:hypothetical protein